jgi:RHS repeat-associated protein
MVGRSGLNLEYRYGFNGMEKDDEISGEGNNYTTEFRDYDSRLGRWLSIDPEFKHFPWQSPYAAFDNNPIRNNDPKGLAAEDQIEGDEGDEDEWCDDCPSTTLEEVVITAKRIPKVVELEELSIQPTHSSFLGAIPKIVKGVYRGIKGIIKWFSKATPKIKKIKDIKPGRNRHGEPKVTFKKGSKRYDVSKRRTKEWTKEPRNPRTGERQVNFKKEGLPRGSKEIPGSKGLKRTPTPREIRILEKNTPNI